MAVYFTANESGSRVRLKQWLNEIGDGECYEKQAHVCFSKF